MLLCGQANTVLKLLQPHGIQKNFEVRMTLCGLFLSLSALGFPAGKNNTKITYIIGPLWLNT